MIVRKADPEDAKHLSRIAEKTFRDTFGAMNSAEDMDRHCLSSFGEGIQAEEIGDPARITLLSEEEGELTGFAQLRWEPPPKCVAAEAPGEIQRLYVVNDWHGKGVAQALMNACIAKMRNHGSDVVWLGVWERNPRALSFYRKSGFVEVGDHVFSVGRDPQRDIVMARRLAGQA